MHSGERDEGIFELDYDVLSASIAAWIIFSEASSFVDTAFRSCNSWSWIGYERADNGLAPVKKNRLL